MRLGNLDTLKGKWIFERWMCNRVDYENDFVFIQFDGTDTSAILCIRRQSDESGFYTIMKYTNFNETDVIKECHIPTDSMRTMYMFMDWIGITLGELEL